MFKQYSHGTVIVISYLPNLELLGAPHRDILVALAAQLLPACDRDGC